MVGVPELRRDIRHGRGLRLLPELRAEDNAVGEMAMTGTETLLVDYIMRHTYSCPVKDDADIDFDKVKNAGIDVVYIRAGQGFSYEDAKFERNYSEAKKSGLKIGVYHYMTARNVEQAKLQAQFFVSLISNKQIDCKLAMDFESFGNLNKTEINEIALAYMKEVERLSKKEVVVYSNTYNAKNTFDANVAKYPLWVAQYGVSQPQDNGKWKNWVGYQYSSTGRVNGISGNVDMDRYTNDIFLKSTEEIPEVDNPKCNYEDRILYKVQFLL